MGKPWPEEWGLLQVMGLTDPKDKMIYISTGLTQQDAQDTLVHEILHMQGLKAHDERFAITEHAMLARAKRLGLHWDPLDE